MCVLAALLMFAIEGFFTNYGSSVEGVSIAESIVDDGITIFVGRIIYGAVPATAFVLFMLHIFKLTLPWVAFGAVNALLLVVFFAIWENQIHLLHRLVQVELPIYENLLWFLLVASFVSPKLLAVVGFWGTFIPIQKKLP
jgi:hypothetical protein